MKYAGIAAVALMAASIAFTTEANVEAKPKRQLAWTKQTHDLNDHLVKIGMPKDVAKSLITNCKAIANDPRHCVKVGSAILGAESSLGNVCHNNNCVGMNDGGVAYKTKDEGIKAWVTKYAKYWYKQPNPSGFYRDDGIKPKTWYCLGPKKDGVCKNGTKNSWAVWNKLSKF